MNVYPVIYLQREIVLAFLRFAIVARSQAASLDLLFLLEIGQASLRPGRAIVPFPLDFSGLGFLQRDIVR